MSSVIRVLSVISGAPMQKGRIASPLLRQSTDVNA
jgi:hypothetical protein